MQLGCSIAGCTGETGTTGRKAAKQLGPDCFKRKIGGDKGEVNCPTATTEARNSNSAHAV